MNSNINAILDKAEDPEKIVRLMIQEMEDTLVEVRSAAARSIADKKELNRKLGAWNARQAIGSQGRAGIRKGRDDLAKAALVEKSRRHAPRTRFRRLLPVDEGSASSTRTSRGSRTNCRTPRRGRSLCWPATKRPEVAWPRRKIHDYKIDDALVRFEQYTRRMDDVEGRVEAYDLGSAEGPQSRIRRLWRQRMRSMPSLPL